MARGNPYNNILSPQQSSGASGFGYYNPYSSYGSSMYQPGQYATTPFGDQYLEDNHESAFTRWLAQNGYGDNSLRSEYARNQYSKVNEGYGAALATNPFLKFQDYLNTVGGTIGNDWNRLTAEERGETSRMFAPRARYVSRV